MAMCGVTFQKCTLMPLRQIDTCHMQESHSLNHAHAHKLSGSILHLEGKVSVLFT